MDETLVSDRDKNTGTLDLGKKHEGCFLSSMQDVSFVLGTKDYHLLLEQIAQKCDVHFCLLPSIPSLENDLQNGEEMEDSVYFDELLSKVQIISSALEGMYAAMQLLIQDQNLPFCCRVWMKIFLHVLLFRVW
jgi:hypothetical protein